MILSYLVLLLTVWGFPVEFTACSKDDWWCGIAYLLTESAGKIGTVIIVLVAAFFYTLRESAVINRLKIFAKTIFSIGLLLALLAFFNENIVKEFLKIARPSHMYVMEKSGMPTGLDSLYARNDEGRKAFLQHIIESHQENFKAIDTTVLRHWIAESGYSFPSGHSANAFLIAYILAYSMYLSRNKAARLLYILPFIWALMVAVSRVAIGAHSALDVSVGAAVGMLVAAMFFYFDKTTKIILRSKS